MRLFFSGFFLRRINVCLILLESLIRLYIWGDFFLRRINVCLILLESLIRLYIGGMVKIDHRLSNLRRFVRYNLFLRCIHLGFLLFYLEIYLARQMLCCICWRNS